MERLKDHLLAALIDTALWAYAALVCYNILWQKLILGLRYTDFDWNTPLLCLAAGAAIALVLLPTRCSTGKALRKLILADPTRSLLRQSFCLPIIVVVILTFIAGLHITQVNVREFFSPAGLGGAKRIFGALLYPNWGIFEQALFAGIETIYMAFIATTAAIPFAFVLSLPAARNLMKGSHLSLGIYSLIRFVMNTSRSIEPLVWAIIFSVWVGIGPFSGMLALWLHSIVSLAKLYSEQVENIDDGPVEAMKATGAHPIQVIWYGVIPQVVLPWLSFTIYRWDINVRMATIIGLVGGGGIGTMLMQYQGLAKWNEVGLLVIVIAAIVWVMDWSSSRIREAIK